MDDCNQDVRRVFVGELLSDSGYKCNGPIEIKRLRQLAYAQSGRITLACTWC